MARMIQIRNVPEDLHRELKARAALAGMSLSDFLLQEVRKIAERPSREEMLERLRSREPVDPGEPIVTILARERGER